MSTRVDTRCYRSGHEIGRKSVDEMGDAKMSRIPESQWFALESRPIEFGNVGPIVRGRVVGSDRWQSITLAVDPVRYLRGVAIVGDIVRGRVVGLDR